MKLIDANLLIYAHIEDMPQHELARRWLDEQINTLPRVGMPWASLLAFVRLVSNPRIFDRSLPVADAWAQVESWLSAPSVWIPNAAERHQEILGLLLTSGEGVRSNLVPDAHLAALAVEHGLTLCSADRGFARFAGLQWENPLAS